MGRWRWTRKGRANPPKQMFGPATNFAAGTGCYAREALPDWVTEPTDEQPTVDPWGQAASGGAEQTSPALDDTPKTRTTPPNRSARFRGECGADRGYPPGWR